MPACNYCDIEINIGEIESHRERCASSPIRCKGCSKHVQKRFLQFHYEHDHRFLSPEEKERAEEEDPEGTEDDECPICLGPITLPVALECGHVFCMVCVKGIASTTKNCAICRRDINRDMLMDIRFCIEEEVIRNYVKCTKTKKAPRSRSVPIRQPQDPPPPSTRDYDNMVSALLSNRTSSSSVRYDRPMNTHTPATYTPYCYSFTSITITEPSTSVSRAHSKPETIQSSSYVNSRSPVTYRRNRDRSEPCEGAVSLPTASSSSPSAARRKRPTSLALSQDDSVPDETETPHLSQEEYDRWLAFQLAQADEDIPAEEFNRRHPMRRSASMPERKTSVAATSTPSSSEDKEFIPDTIEKCASAKAISSLPPTVPSTHRPRTPNQLSTESDSLSPTDCPTGSSSSARSSSTGARPKSSTALRKRVSFKEESTSKREAPVLLPCEFCDKMYSERDLMRHQTSCDFNETKNPREYLQSRRSSVTSPTSPLSGSYPSSPVTPNNTAIAIQTLPSPTSPVSPVVSKSSPLPSPSSTHVDVTICLPPPRRHARAPPHPNSKSLSSQSSTDTPSPKNEKPSTSTNKTSPVTTQSISSGICSATSSFNSTSISNTPNTSSSASPIPISTGPDTPTDVEADMEDDGTTSYTRPKKGKLLSSAITSWRAISGPKSKDKPKYFRSNTAPPVPNSISGDSIEAETEKESESSEPKAEANEPSKSNSSPYIRGRKAYKAPSPPPVSLNSEMSGVCTKENKKTSNMLDSLALGENLSVFDASSIGVNKDDSDQKFLEFLERRKTHRAPPPPPPTKSHSEDHDRNGTLGRSSLLNAKNNPRSFSQDEPYSNSLSQTISSSNSSSLDSNSPVRGDFKFDSMPMMNGSIQHPDSNVQYCPNCNKPFSPKKLKCHQTICKAKKPQTAEGEQIGREIPITFARREEATKESDLTVIPVRYRKGPAPQPPKRDSPEDIMVNITRSNSARERASAPRTFEYDRPHSYLERRSSVKEPSRLSRFLENSSSFLSRRWMSRDTALNDSNIENTMASNNGTSSLCSSTTSLNSISTTKGWYSTLNLSRDDYGSRRASTSLGLSNTSLSYGTSRYRERSVSRSRPSSLLYSSRNAGSMLLGDTLAAIERKRRTLC